MLNFFVRFFLVTYDPDGFGVQMPTAVNKNFGFPKNVHTGCTAQESSYSMSARGFVSG
jgi:hypothetical protein